MGLKLLDLATAGHAFFLFNLFDGGLAVQGCGKKHFVTVEFNLMCLLT